MPSLESLRPLQFRRNRLGTLIHCPVGEVPESRPQTLSRPDYRRPATAVFVMANRAQNLPRPPFIAFASGWMSIRQRAKQRGVELPLVISDHADWGELPERSREVNPEELWVTYGREDALSTLGRTGRPPRPRAPTTTAHRYDYC